MKLNRWIMFETECYGGKDANGIEKWIPKRFYRCSKCRKGTVVKTPYCPYCGAEMDWKKP